MPCPNDEKEIGKSETVCVTVLHGIVTGGFDSRGESRADVSGVSE
jgi:hypothetical protein